MAAPLNPPFRMMKPVLALLLALVVSPLRANDPGGGAPGVGANVTLTDNGSSVVLANGQVSATITKDNAKFTAYTYRGVPLTTSTRQIYYSMDGGTNYRQPSGCTYTVKTNTPDMVDIGTITGSERLPPHRHHGRGTMIQDLQG